MNVADNPFFLLDASPRDSKRIIHEKAENKSFDLPDETCKNAERILLNPRKRLGAEISWFPGVSPKKVKEVLKKIIEDASNHNYDPVFFRQFDNLPRANAFAFFLSNISDPGYWSQDDIENIVRSFCEFTSEIDAGPTLDSMNEDRIASGFPEISSGSDVEQELEEQQRYYKKILHSFLDILNSSVIIDILTRLIEDNTESGEFECDWPLLDDIITDYEMESIPFFEKQEEIIFIDINEINKIIENNSSLEMISGCIGKLEEDVHSWDKIAQPIQVLYKSKGIEHKRSSVLANKIRQLSIAAYKKNDLADLSERLSRLLLEVFAEVPLVEETISEDLKFLTTSGKDKKKIEAIRNAIKKYEIIATSASSARETFQKCWDEVIPLIKDLYDVNMGKNFLASFFLHYIIEYANHQHNYSVSVELLEKIRPLITDKILLAQYEKNAFIIKQNQIVKNSETEDKISRIKYSVVIVLVIGIIGGIAGGYEGALGGIGFGVFLMLYGLLLNYLRR